MTPFQNVSGYNQANLHAGIDPATGKPFYLAGYDAQMQPVFTWNPQFVAAEHGGRVVDRSSGHFADAVGSGGQFGQLGEYISNAQGSMYQTQQPNQLAGGTPTLQQTGTYQAPGQPQVPQQPQGGPGVNQNLLSPNPPAAPAPPPAPTNQATGNRVTQGAGVQTQPHQAVQQAAPPQNDFRTAPQNQPFFNQAGPNQGGLSNLAVYGPNNQYNRVPWQNRLQGGGGAANDRPGYSASRLF